MENELNHTDELEFCLKRFAMSKMDGRFVVDLSNNGGKYEIFVKDGILMKYTKLHSHDFSVLAADIPTDRASAQAFAEKYLIPRGVTWANVPEMDDEQLIGFIDGLQLWIVSEMRKTRALN